MLTRIAIFRIAGLIALAASLFFAGWKLRDYQAIAEERDELAKVIKEHAEEIDRREAVENELNATSIKLEAELQNLRAKQKQRAVKYAKPVHDGCAVPSDSVQSLIEAVGDVNAARSR